MLAAENGGLPGGKVGGMGDVIRDLPKTLAAQGHAVSVVSPAYGFLDRLPGVRAIATLNVPFAGTTEAVRLLEVPADGNRLSYYLLAHPRFTPDGARQIYCSRADEGPFETDASKFAFFSAAAAEFVRTRGNAGDVVHVHDWHPALFLLLGNHDPAYSKLRRIRTVFTIHNLALQGTRPLGGSASSFRSWFPALRVPPELLADPQYPDCINPLAIAIRLADFVNTVSPGYAQEIVRPNDQGAGRHGGEGLEQLLAARLKEGKLSGILNGCEYPARPTKKTGWRRLLANLEAQLETWIADEPYVDSAAWLALQKIRKLPKKRPAVVATSIGRATDQKLRLFREPTRAGTSALDDVLHKLEEGLLIIVGSGDPDYELFLQQTMARHDNFLFLKGYSDPVANMLYASGDLFLMPSSFEPCGISQMLAMRAGQPCVAHAVGGLADTVERSSGFPFNGTTPLSQAQNFVSEVDRAVKLKRTQPEQWKRICATAQQQRFTWDKSAQHYIEDVYGFDTND